MRKYLDLIGTAGVVALVAISAFNLFSNEGQKGVQPVVYQQGTACDLNNVEDISGCSTPPNYEMLQISKKRTIDI